MVTLRLVSGELLAGSKVPTVLNCSASMGDLEEVGNYTFDFTWTLRSVTLAPSIRMSFEMDASQGHSILRILPIRASDEDFNCLARARVASILTRTSEYYTEQLSLSIEGADFAVIIEKIVLMLTYIITLFFSDPMRLPLALTSASGVALIGQSFNITCSVEDRFRLSPSLAWLDINGKTLMNHTSANIYISSPNSTSLTLSLIPVSEEHNGTFSCTAELLDPVASLNLSNSSAVQIFVTRSMFVEFYR